VATAPSIETSVAPRALEPLVSPRSETKPEPEQVDLTDPQPTSATVQAPDLEPALELRVPARAACTSDSCRSAELAKPQASEYLSSGAASGRNTVVERADAMDSPSPVSPGARSVGAPSVSTATPPQTPYAYPCANANPRLVLAPPKDPGVASKMLFGLAKQGTQLGGKHWKQVESGRFLTSSEEAAALLPSRSHDAGGRLQIRARNHRAVRGMASRAASTPDLSVAITPSAPPPLAPAPPRAPSCKAQHHMHNLYKQKNSSRLPPLVAGASHHGVPNGAARRQHASRRSESMEAPHSDDIVRAGSEQYLYKRYCSPESAVIIY